MTNHEALTTGAFPAMITPFDAAGGIDHEALTTEARRLEAAGVDGLVPVGSTGESATLSHDEHVEVVETVVDAVDDVPVIAGSGSNNTNEALELSRRSAAAGADGLLLISPYYNNPEPAGMAAHYRLVANEVDIPQILYNVPGRTGRNISVETVLDLAEHENIVGYKAASGDVTRIGEIVERTRDLQFNVLSGDDALTVPIISVGGSGVISVAGNVAPERVSGLVGAALAGDYETAQRYHHELGPLFRTLFIETNPIPVKAAMAMMGRCEPDLRLPLSELSAEHREELAGVLEELGLLPLEADGSGG